MELDQFINQINTGLQRLPEDLKLAFDVVGLSAKALIQNRIQEHGTDAKGALLAPYSKKYLDYKSGKTGYNEKPKLPSNRYRGFTDFTLTGAMWNNIQILQSGFSNESVEVLVGAQSPDNNAKMEFISVESGKWPDMLEMANDEIETCSGVLDGELQKIANKLFQ